MPCETDMQWSPIHGGFPAIRTSDMDYRGRIQFKEPPRVRTLRVSEDHFTLQAEDLLVTRTGAVIGMCAPYGASLGRAIAAAYKYRLPKKAAALFVGLIYVHEVASSSRW